MRRAFLTILVVTTLCPILFAGQFLQPDPGYDYETQDPMSWNLYTYVRRNPIAFSDPTGMNWFQVNGAYEWHDGDQYTYTDDEGNEQTLHSDVELLVVYNVTGHDDEGARVGDITIFGEGYDDVIAQRQNTYIDAIVPPDVNVEENKKAAEAMNAWFSSRIQQGHYLAIAEKYYWFYEMVKATGEWGKYKLLDSKYENFGNWQYGLLGVCRV